MQNVLMVKVFPENVELLNKSGKMLCVFPDLKNISL